MTRPSQHPLHQCICKAREYKQGTPHPSNLENIGRYFPEYLRTMETIYPYIRPPWWTLKANIHIDGNKDKAEKYHLQAISNPIPGHPTTHIYTDGSGINDGIGAAIFCPTSLYTEQRYLSTASESIVYAAELEAISMAITHVNELTTGLTNIRRPKTCCIFTDSQPAIKSLTKPKRQSEQEIIKRILDLIDKIHEAAPTYTIHLEWVPEHVGIEGNEKADQAAKQAATQKTNPLPKKTILKSARANAIYQSIKQQNQNEWNNGKKTAVPLRQMSNTITAKAKPPTHIYEKLGNKRKRIAWIARLRTGHCSLNQYLARF